MILRPYQQAIETSIRQAFRAGRRAPLVTAPTGSGKTVTFCSIAEQAAARGNSSLILVHRKELLMQTSAALDSMGVTHGLIAPGHQFSPVPVQVASVQTLVRRAPKLDWRPDLIIVDECHHATTSSTWGKVLSYYDKPIIGFTATPERLDGRGLGTHDDGFFDEIIIGPSVRELTDQGYLSPAVVYAPGGGVDLSGIHTRAGDYAKNEIAAAMDTPRITGDAVEHYRRICPGEPNIVFCATVAHAEHAAEDYRRAGYQASSIDGKLDDKSRRERIEDLGTGKLNVLTSCEIISEGVDVPVIVCATLLRPTKSLGLCMQQIGRALRIHPGKTRAVIFDHVGNVLRHGLPDQDREWSLDASRRSKRGNSDVFPVRQCPKCYLVHRPAPVCPGCRHEYEIEAREIQEVDGELGVISQEHVDLARAKQMKRREQGQAKTLDELIKLGAGRGYKPGWAHFIFNSRRGKQ